MNMQKIRLLLWLLLIFVLNSLVAIAAVVTPPPQVLFLKGYNLALDYSWHIVVDTMNPQDKFTAEELQQDIAQKYGVSLGIVDASTLTTGTASIIIGNPISHNLIGQVAAQMGVVLPSDLDKEGYILEVGHDCVLILGTSEPGLFYGSKTLLQLMRQKDVSSVLITAVKISDYPDLKLRGVDICGSDYVNTAYQQIDELSRLKINTMTFDSIDNYELDNPAKRVLVQNIFNYCRQRHIEPIPRLEPWVVSVKDPNNLSGLWLQDEKFKFVDNKAEAKVTAPNLSLNIRCESRNEISGHGGIIQETGVGQISFESSQTADYGNGIYLNGSSSSQEQILIPKVYFNAVEGTIEFWFKPKWNYNDNRSHYLLSTPFGDNQISISKLDNNYLYWSIRRNGTFHRLCSTDAYKWNANEWHHLAVTWGAQGSEIYLDGQVVRPLLFRDDVYVGDINIPVNNVTIGSEDGGGNPADAVFDEIRIWNKQRVPFLGLLRDGDSVLENSGFETDSDGNGIPDGWTLGANWSWEPYGHDSNHCMKASNTGTYDGDSGWLSGLLVEADPEMWYNLYFWAKTSGVGGSNAPAIRIRELDANGIQLLDTQGSWIQHNYPLMSWAGWGDYWRKGEFSFKTDSRCRKLQIYANIYYGYGIVWFDDLKLTRLGGALLNVIQTASTDINVTNLTKTTTYSKGVDYEVIAGNIADWSVDHTATVIRRLSTGSISANQEVLVNYDSAFLVNGAAFPYCYSEPRVYDILYRVIDNFLDDPLLKPKYMQVGQYSEVCGINRDSRDRKRNMTNAALLAEDLTKINNRIKAKDPNTRLMIWDDMLNPYHNGGNENYQVSYGGYPGKTSLAIDSISKDIILNCWWYDSSDWLGKMANTPAYFNTKGFTWLGTAWKDKNNIDQWIPIAKSNSQCLGLMGSTWLDGGGWDGSLEGVKYVADKSWAVNPKIIAPYAAAWSMDEGSGIKVYDASFKDNDGTINGANWIQGVSGNALSFDGTNDYLVVPDSSTLNLTYGIVVSAWVKINNWNNCKANAIILKKFTSGSPDTGYVLCREGLANNLIFKIGTSGGTVVRRTPALQVNTWYNIIAVFDLFSVKLYVNNSETGTSGDNNFSLYLINSSNDSLYIGGAPTGEYFSGAIDDVKIYNVELSLSAPANIVDLIPSLGNVPGSVALSWTVPLSDFNNINYIVKYSTNPINTQGDFDNAATFAQNWGPGAPGTVENKIITGLTPGEGYYFCIEAVNQIHQVLPLSNSAYYIARTNTVGVSATGMVDLGLVLAGTTASGGPITVTNIGGVPITLNVGLTNPPGWEAGLNNEKQNQYVLMAACGTSLDSINWNISNHALSTTPQTCSMIKFAGDQTGMNVGLDDTRKLWIRFIAPSVVSFGTESQKIYINVTAGSAE